MTLRKEVLHRLLLAKSILSLGRNASYGQPNAHLVAKQVLNAHDAADLIFAAIADQQNKLPPERKDSMMQCLEAIEITADRHKGYFKQLNDARNGLKHSGVLPNTNYWASVALDVFEKLSSICQATLNASLEDLDESDLLASDEARAHLAAAKLAKSSQDFKLALEEIGNALFVSLQYAPDVGGIQVGQPKAEDALKLTAFGVPANDFLRLQEFLPQIFHGEWSESSNRWAPSEPLWKQTTYGHPGNWREDVIDFCIMACLNVALSIQNASPVPYAFEFAELYKYKVTARIDRVEVWDDLVEENEHTIQGGSNSTRPSRTHNRFLNKGESVIVSGHTRPFVSEDVSLSGKSIKRVRLTYDLMSVLFAGAHTRAEFVNLEDVQISCVPTNLYRNYFPDLPEIPWEGDEPLL